MQIYLALDFDCCFLFVVAFATCAALACCRQQTATFTYGHCYDLCGKNISGALPVNVFVAPSFMPHTLLCRGAGEGREQGWSSGGAFHVRSQIQFQFAPHQKTNKARAKSL